MPATAEPDVAKKKTEKPPDGPREAVITFRCRASYRDWLIGFARSRRVTPTQLIDQGLECLARHGGFEAPPER